MTSLDGLTPAQQHVIRSATARLTGEFAGVFSPQTIERFMAESLDQFLPDARVTAFAPDLRGAVHSRSAAALRAKLEGTVVSEKPAVLFLCVHNAGRSQMAAGWLRHLAGDRVEVYSGGSEPATQVNPAAIDAMAEAGIDIRAEYPKPWTDEIVRAADVVVTMGCGDACPFYPGKRYEDWELDDPAGLDVPAVRPIRDEIRRRVEVLMASLDVAPVA